MTLLRMILRLGVLLIVTTAPVIAQGQNVQGPDICVPCAPKSEHVEGQTVKFASFHFTWTSEWHQVDSTKYCFYRQVANNGEKALYYSWPLAGFARNVALEPGSSDKVCTYGGGNRNPSTPASLYYGRTGYKAQTHVWQTTDEKNEESRNSFISTHGLASRQSADLPRLQLTAAHIEGLADPKFAGIEYSPLLTTYKIAISLRDRKRRYLLFIPLPRKTRSYKVDMTFASEVERTQKGYEVRNSVVSLNPQQALPNVDWNEVDRGGAAVAVVGASAGGGLFPPAWIGRLGRLLVPGRSTPELPTSTQQPSSHTKMESSRFTQQPILRITDIPILTKSGEQVIRLRIAFWSTY